MTDRRNWIGGSDCAAVLGMSRWKTQLAVWAEKTGNIEPEDISGKLQVQLGIELEDFVARKFMEATGKKVINRKERAFHPEYPFIEAEVDRHVEGANEIVECKTASAYKDKEWVGEEMPQEYILQVYHQLAVTGADRGYIAVLIGNHDFKWKVIERDEKAIKSIIEREVKFWREFVEPKVMPLTIAADDADTLFQLYPQEEPGSVIQLGDEADRIIDNIKALTADKLSVERIIDQQKNELKALLKNNEAGEGNKFEITWKVQNVEEYTVPARKQRVLRYKEKKQEA